MSAACMGGGCERRETCRVYHNVSGIPVIERLCERGDDDCYEPIPRIRPATERPKVAALLRPATWMDMVEN